MNKNFAKIIFVVTLFVGTFFSAGSAKAINCCLIERGFKGQVMTLVDCRLQASTPCKTELSCVYQGCVLNDGVLVQTESSANCTVNPTCKEKIAGVKSCDGLIKDDCGLLTALCFWSPQQTKCLSRMDSGSCGGYSKTECLLSKDVCVWVDDEENPQDSKCTTPLGAATSKRYEDRSDLLPSCAADGSCRKMSDILYPVLKVMELIFKYIGAIAFIFFVLGGFTMILSFGNPEKFKKGRDILVAAVIGLLIVFGAYLLITFVVEALGVGSEFKAL